MCEIGLWVGVGVIGEVMLEEGESNGVIRVIGRRDYILLYRDTQYDRVVLLIHRPILVC